MPMILRLPSVQQRTGLSRSSIYRLMQIQLFPKPISLGPRSVGWIEKEIDNWLQERIAQRDLGLPSGSKLTNS